MSLSQGLFSFGQFITGLALLVVLFTITDIRFKFRIAVARTHLRALTYFTIAFIGFATLVTDLWNYEQWPPLPIPHYWGPIWQAILGGLFLFLFLVWMYHGFIRPPIFTQGRAVRFGQQLYAVLVKGNAAEIAIIADELSFSAHNIIGLWRPVEAETKHQSEQHQSRRDRKRSQAAGYAHNLLLMIASPIMCKQIVESCPRTALLFAKEATEQKRYEAPLGEFLRNISEIAIGDENSSLYHEGKVFAHDYIGQVKPWSRAIYGDFLLIEALATSGFSPLDIDYRTVRRWTAKQWRAYSVAVLTTMADYLTKTNGMRHSFALARAFGKFETCISAIPMLNGVSGVFGNSDEYSRLEVAVDFIKSAVDLLDNGKVPPPRSWRASPRRENAHLDWTIFDEIADLMYKVLSASSAIRAPLDTAHFIHYNAIWGHFFGNMATSKSWKIVQGKFQRILQGEVKRVDKFPDYMNTAILGVLLNVMWHEIVNNPLGFGRPYRGLARAVSTWMKRNYLRLRERDAGMADYVLLGGIEFDASKNRVGKRYLNNPTGPVGGPWLQL